MRLKLRAVTMAVGLLALCAVPAKAQVELGVGGSGLFSLEDNGGSDFGAMAKFGWVHESGFGFRIDGTGIFNDAPGTVVILGAGLLYEFATAETSMFRPYLVAGASYFTNTEEFFDNDFSDFGIQGGAGFKYALQSVNLFAEGIFDNVFTDPENTQDIRANVGVSFMFGGGGADGM